MRYTVLAAAAFAIFASPALAVTDEIQIYTGDIEAPGTFGLTWHNNYTPSGLKTPEFPGALVDEHAYSSVTEWAYGVTDWFEAGLYLPLYSVSKDRGATINGGKLRMLFVRPHADNHTFFYGMNFEFSYNARHWDMNRFTSEIRPIIGLHLHPIDIIVNPILDNSYRGGFKSLDFAPSTRVAYNFSPQWAGALEEYADIGPLRQFLPRGEQSHQIFAVVDHGAKFLNIEAGVGFGLTGAADKVTLKLMLSRDLYTPNKH